MDSLKSSYQGYDQARIPETTERFVVWHGASLDACGAKDVKAFESILRSIGVPSLEQINRSLPTSFGPHAEEVETFLVVYNLGARVRLESPRPISETAWNEHNVSELPISRLNLSTRPHNCLVEAKIETVGELMGRDTASLLRLPNMGRKSVTEIEERLSFLRSGFQQERAPSVSDRSIQLGLLLRTDQCKLHEDIVARMGKLDISYLWQLVKSSDGLATSRYVLTEAQMQEVQFCVKSMGLSFGMRIPELLVDHFGELLIAFRPDIDAWLQSTIPRLNENDDVFGPLEALPVATCLEEELEHLLPHGLKDQKKLIVYRNLGWDGGFGETLADTGKAFSLTRERIRQVVDKVLSQMGTHPTPLLRKAVDCIWACCPCLAEVAEEKLLQNGIVRRWFSAESIEKTANMMGIDTPWKIEEFASHRYVLDEPSSSDVLRTHAEARRRISHFGLTSVSYVAGALADSIQSDKVKLYCSLLPEIVWLDSANDWFWVPTARNCVQGRLVKILRAVPTIGIETARLGILRDSRMENCDLPSGIFRAFCELMPWCRIRGNDLLAEADLPPGEEETHEAALLQILKQHGPVMRRRDLFRVAAAGGMEKVHFDRLLSDSNIIVKLAPGVYGLIGSGTENLQFTGEIEEEQENGSESIAPEAPEDNFQSTLDVLQGCDPETFLFPLQLLSQVISRAAHLRGRGWWSLAELELTGNDRAKLKQWLLDGVVQLWQIKRERVADGATFVGGTDALALTFLLAGSEIVRTTGTEGEVWKTIEAALGPRLHQQLFQAPSIPRRFVREATERICSRLKLRHLFGREGEQAWLRTVFLQFGLTRAGWQRLPIWLIPSSALPVTIEDLLSSPVLQSESFRDLWQTLQSYRCEQMSETQALVRLRKNRWVPEDELPSLLNASIQHRNIQQQESAASVKTDSEPTEGLLGHCLLRWTGELPAVEITLQSRSRWLTEARYILVIDGIRRIPIHRQSDGYRFDSNIVSIGLDSAFVKVDLMRGQVRCFPEPMTIDVAPTQYDFMFYDLGSGEPLTYGNEIIRPGRDYGLLTRSNLDVTQESLEMRRVFGGDWTLRAFRGGIPARLEIRRDRNTLWAANESCQSNRPLAQHLRPTVRCPGGRWGDIGSFIVPAIPGNEPQFLLLDGKRLPLETLPDGSYLARAELSPNADYDAVPVRIECLSKNRLRWVTATLEIGSLQGIAIDSVSGWRVLRESADMDAEYLREHRIKTGLPSRYDGEDVQSADWVWMEGEHICGRPRKAASVLGTAVYAVGEQLSLSVGPYNRRPGGEKLARSLIHSGVIARIERTSTQWQLQLRCSFSFTEDHAVWIWLPNGPRPEKLGRDKWQVEDDICKVTLEDTSSAIALAISYEGMWLGARTCQRGWAGFADLIEASGNWPLTARWLKWWRVPLLHNILRSITMEAARVAPLETIQSWTTPLDASGQAYLSEEYEEAWNSVTRNIFWDWKPTTNESAGLLRSLDLLSGNSDIDLERGWEECERLISINPTLFVQVAERGAGSLYPDTVECQFLLNRLANKLLDLDVENYSAEIRSQALKDWQRRAAEAMGNVDDLFILRSLVPDAVASLQGTLRNDHNLRLAMSNSYVVPRYLAAALMDLKLREK